MAFRQEAVLILTYRKHNTNENYGKILFPPASGKDETTEGGGGKERRGVWSQLPFV